MSVNLNAVSRERSLAGFLASQPPSATAGQAAEFEQQLASAIRDSLSQAGVAAGQVQVSLAGSRNPASPGARQILVTISQPAAAAQAAAQSPAPEAHADNAAASGAADPVQVLKDALTAAGLDPGRFSLSESREVVGYPGGSYINHVIVADLGGGIRECYGVELMLRNPQVTVVEIQRALRSSGAV